MPVGAAVQPIGDNITGGAHAVHNPAVVPAACPRLSTEPVAGDPAPVGDNAGFCVPPPGGKRLTVTDSSTSRPALPDHLSIDPRSPHHVAAVFEHDVGIRFNGKERFDVEEYCVSEGWVKVPAGKTLDRKGRPLLLTLKGTVEAFYK